MNVPSEALFRRILACCAAMFLIVVTSASAVAAGITLQISQTASHTEASIRNWQVVTFRISYAVTSTTQGASNASIAFFLDPKFELISMQKNNQIATTNFNNILRLGTFSFEANTPAGSSGEVSVQVRFPQTTPDGTIANFRPSFVALNALPVLASNLSVKAIDPPVPGGGGPIFVRGIKIAKWGPDTFSDNTPTIAYSIQHGNTGPAGEDVPSYVIEDIFPTGTRLNYFHNERFPGTSNEVTVSYRTNLNASWRQWGVTYLYKTGDGTSYFNATDVGLAVGEFISGLRFNYGTLPGGGPFHPDNQTQWLGIVLDYTPSPPAPASIQNCATASGSGVSSVTGCQASTVTPAVPNYYTWTNQIAGYPIEMGETFTIKGALGQYPNSNADMVNPMMIVRLPPEFEYVGNFALRSGYAWSPPAPVPDFVQDENFGGVPGTLLRWRWSALKPFTLPAINTWNEIRYTFDVRVRPGTPNGSYRYLIYNSWEQPGSTTSEWQVVDTRDRDGDGSTTDTLLTTDDWVNVETNGGLATVTATMEVKGELDSTWSKFPATGLTVPSGKADYQLTIANTGGIIMKDPILIDILPALNDRGVIDTSPRESAWEPFLAGEVTAPAGLTVYYSTSKNPCRDELTPGLPAGCEAPAWSTTPPADITKVKSLKFDGTGLNIRPLEQVVITWPMRAPLTAPTNGEIAWNSFGMILKRADDNTSTLPTEPVKTGITIEPPAPPYYGDLVWLDTNKNGIQDSGETGVNGVRVELYRDNGDNTADPNADTLVSFTVTSTGAGGDGYYRFGNIGAGNYFAVITPPDGFAPTTPDAGADDQKDSDGQALTHRGRRAAIFPVTELVLLEEDNSWDLGIYERSGIPSVWAVAPQSDGKIFIGGKFISTHGLARRNVARILANGQPDPTFDPGTGFDGTVRSLALRSDGLLLAGGSFTTYNGQAAAGIALLHPNGNLAGVTAQPDTSDINWVGAKGTSMFVTGAFGKIAGQPCGNIAALNADGTISASFTSLPGANDSINCGAILSDGSLILVGAFTSYGGLPRGRAVKVKADGTVDPLFKPETGANGEIYSIKLIEDGRIYLTGAFTAFEGVTCNGTVRLKADGTPDGTPAPSTLAVKSINASN